jgi:hypothetical protein
MNTIALRTVTEKIVPGDLIARERIDEQHFGPVVEAEAEYLSADREIVVAYTVKNAEGETRRVRRNGGFTVIRPTEVEAGTGATIHLYTDSVAAVVVKATKTQVHVRRVETGEETTVEMRGDFPVRESEGILDAPTGPVEVYRVGKDGRLAGGGDRSIRLSLGRSISRTDYSF